MVNIIDHDKEEQIERHWQFVWFVLYADEKIQRSYGKAIGWW